MSWKTRILGPVLKGGNETCCSSLVRSSRIILPLRFPRGHMTALLTLINTAVLLAETENTCCWTIVSAGKIRNMVWNEVFGDCRDRNDKVIAIKLVTLERPAGYIHVIRACLSRNNVISRSTGIREHSKVLWLANRSAAAKEKRKSARSISHYDCSCLSIHKSCSFKRAAWWKCHSISLRVWCYFYHLPYFFLAIVFPFNYLSVPSARGIISTALTPESQTTVSRLSGAKQAKYPQKPSHAYD